jgi:glycine betaine/proline transport system substrate-binding protein
MNKKSSYVPLKALLFAVFAALALPAGAVESKDPIKLTLHDWTGQYLTTTLMGEVLKKAGYNIEYVQADYIAQFAGLPARPSISAKPEWMPRKSGGIRCT